MNKRKKPPGELTLNDSERTSADERQPKRLLVDPTPTYTPDDIKRMVFGVADLRDRERAEREKSEAGKLQQAKPDLAFIEDFHQAVEQKKRLEAEKAQRIQAQSSELKAQDSFDLEKCQQITNSSRELLQKLQMKNAQLQKQAEKRKRNAKQDELREHAELKKQRERESQLERQRKEQRLQEEEQREAQLERQRNNEEEQWQAQLRERREREEREWQEALQKRREQETEQWQAQVQNQREEAERLRKQREEEEYNRMEAERLQKQRQEAELHRQREEDQAELQRQREEDQAELQRQREEDQRQREEDQAASQRQHEEEEQAEPQGRLVKQKALPTVWRDATDQGWTAVTALGDADAKTLEKDHNGWARGKKTWQFYARLLRRKNTNTSGEYCVQCDVVSHNTAACDLQIKDVACTKCTTSGRACSKLIIHEGELKMAWLPLPMASRLGVAWQNLRYWVLPKPKKGATR